LDSSPSKRLLMADLEASSFEIFEKEVQHDVAAMLIFVQKYDTYEKSAYYAKLDWKKRLLEAPFGFMELNP
jgi:hypothetical protein